MHTSQSGVKLLFGSGISFLFCRLIGGLTRRAVLAGLTKPGYFFAIDNHSHYEYIPSMVIVRSLQLMTSTIMLLSYCHTGSYLIRFLVLAHWEASGSAVQA